MVLSLCNKAFHGVSRLGQWAACRQTDCINFELAWPAAWLWNELPELQPHGLTRKAGQISGATDPTCVADLIRRTFGPCRKSMHRGQDNVRHGIPN